MESMRRACNIANTVRSVPSVPTRPPTIPYASIIHVHTRHRVSVTVWHVWKCLETRELLELVRDGWKAMPNNAQQCQQMSNHVKPCPTASKRVKPFQAMSNGVNPCQDMTLCRTVPLRNMLFQSWVYTSPLRADLCEAGGCLDAQELDGCLGPKHPSNTFRLA